MGDPNERALRRVLGLARDINDRVNRTRLREAGRSAWRVLHEGLHAVFDQLQSDGVNTGEIYTAPILADVDVDRFVDEWLGLPKREGEYVGQWLTTRWKTRLVGSLEDETSTAQALLEELERRASTTDGFERARRRRMHRALEHAISASA